MLKNQRVRVGVSVNPDPARRMIVNLQLDGGSTTYYVVHITLRYSIGYDACMNFSWSIELFLV